MRPLSSAKTWAAVVGLVKPERLAEGAAMGALKAFNRAWAMGWLGTRRATVVRPAETRGEIPGPRGRMRVRGPGQKALVSFSAVSGQWVVRRRGRRGRRVRER